MGLNEAPAGPDGAPRGPDGAPPASSGAPRGGPYPYPYPYPSAIRVEIGELVLDGFDDRVDPDRVSAAFQAELARLLRERGVPLAADGADRELDLLSGLPPLPATTSPGRLGEALARAVHAGLSGRGREERR